MTFNPPRHPNPSQVKRYKTINLKTETEKELTEKLYELKIELEKKWENYHTKHTHETICTHDIENNTLTYTDTPSGLAITTDLSNEKNKHINQLLEQIQELEEELEKRTSLETWGPYHYW